jgi:hypothetical protein
MLPTLRFEYFLVVRLFGSVDLASCSMCVGKVSLCL